MSDIKDLFIFEPHNFLFVGVTNCGKSYLVLNLLETVYKGHFENIVIFCPTFSYNRTYDRRWLFKDKNVIILNPELVKHHLDKLLSISIEIYKGSKTLFIIDDCGNLADVKQKKSQLSFLGFSGRHFGISTWVLVQKYNSVVKDFRENIRQLCLFFCKDEKAISSAFEENAIVPKEFRKLIEERLKDNIILRHENMRF